MNECVWPVPKHHYMECKEIEWRKKSYAEKLGKEQHGLWNNHAVYWGWYIIEYSYSSI